jgi:hypothetical protein
LSLGGGEDVPVGVLEDLRSWYVAQCDGDWEHTYGIRIDTMDNTGWCVQIDLRDTLLKGKQFDPIDEGLETDDLGLWIRCSVEGSKFRGFGDLGRLEQILGIFLDWAKTRPDWLAIPHSEDLQARDDREFWDLLNRSLANETCGEEGCEELRVRSSILCPFHHFEQVTGRACPFPGKSA